MSTEQVKSEEVKARVSEDLRARLEELADERSSPGHRVTVSEIVREGLWDYLNRQEDSQDTARQ
jgi:predicted transcriptional regulator